MAVTAQPQPPLADWRLLPEPLPTISDALSQLHTVADAQSLKRPRTSPDGRDSLGLKISVGDEVFVLGGVIPVLGRVLKITLDDSKKIPHWLRSHEVGLALSPQGELVIVKRGFDPNLPLSSRNYKYIQRYLPSDPAPGLGFYESAGSAPYLYPATLKQQGYLHLAVQGSKVQVEFQGGARRVVPMDKILRLSLPQGEALATQLAALQLTPFPREIKI